MVVFLEISKRGLRDGTCERGPEVPAGGLPLFTRGARDETVLRRRVLARELVTAGRPARAGGPCAEVLILGALPYPNPTHPTSTLTLRSLCCCLRSGVSGRMLKVTEGGAYRHACGLAAVKFDPGCASIAVASRRRLRIIYPGSRHLSTTPRSLIRVRSPASDEHSATALPFSFSFSSSARAATFRTMADSKPVDPAVCPPRPEIFGGPLD